MIRPSHKFLIISASLALGTAVFAATESSLSGDILSDLLTAEMAGQQEMLPTALEKYVKLAKKNPKNPAIAERATQIALYSGNIKAALTVSEIWAEAAPHNPQAQLILATLILKTSDSVRDLQAPLERLLVISTADSTVSFSRFIEQMVGEEPEKFSKTILNALKKLSKDKQYKHNPDVFLAVANLALKTDQSEEANKAIQQAALTNPSHPEISFLQAKILLVEDKHAAALDLLGKISQQFPNHYGIQILYAKLLMKSNNLQLAEVQYDKLLKQFPNDSNVLLGLTLIKIERQNYPSAEDLISKAEGILPNNPVLLFYKGYLAEKRGQLAQALKHYDPLIKDLQMFVAYIQTAAIFSQQNRTDEALQLLNSVTPADEEEIAQLAKSKASIYYATGQYSNAITVLNAAIEKFPKRIDLVYDRAMVLEKQGLLNQVEQDFKRILEFDPNNAEILNAYGYLLADRTDKPTRYKEALEMITKALRLRPRDPSVLDSMGWVQYRLGNYPEAESYLRQAYQLKAQAEISAHLGEILWINNKKPEAEAIWQKALQQDKDNTILNSTIQKLKGTVQLAPY